DVEEEFQLPVREARGDVLGGGGRGFGGEFDAVEDAGGGFFGDGEGVAHDVREHHHAQDSAE
ncbi:hypothetical protein LTS01_026151, partial [Friedmanniomyces endolithicus]